MAVEQALTKALAIRARDRFATPTEFAQALAQPRSERKYGSGQVREIVQRAAEGEATHPTEEEAMSLGGLQQIGAEVGIRPGHIKEAADAVDRLAEPHVPRGGLFGMPSRVYLERVIECEVPEEEFGAILEDIQGTMGEVGRINPTLGKSLSWNSLSMQNTLDGARLMHVMVSPKGGQTRIRITETGGPLAIALTVGGGIALAGLIGIFEMLGLRAEWFVVVPVLGAMLGGCYMAARTVFRRVVGRRHRMLQSLFDRISNHVAETGTVPVDRVLTPGDRE